MLFLCDKVKKLFPGVLRDKNLKRKKVGENGFQQQRKNYLAPPNMIVKCCFFFVSKAAQVLHAL